MNPSVTHRITRPLTWALLSISIGSLGGCGLLQSKSTPELSTRNISAQNANSVLPSHRNDAPAAKLVSTDPNKLSPEKLAEGLRLARLLRDQGQLQAASEVYSQMDQRNALRPLELLEYATVSASVSQPQDSLALFGRARRLLDTSTLTPAANLAMCNGLARAKLALGQTDAALADFDCVLRIDPNSISALNGKGILLDAQGQHNEARELLKKAYTLDPADARTLNNLALSHLSDGNTKQAIRLLSQASGMQEPTVRLNLAFAYLLDQQGSRARQTLLDFMPGKLVDSTLVDLEQRRNSVRQGQSISEVLLAASRQALPLQESKE